MKPAVALRLRPLVLDLALNSALVVRSAMGQMHRGRGVNRRHADSFASSTHREVSAATSTSSLRYRALLSLKAFAHSGVPSRHQDLAIT